MNYSALAVEIGLPAYAGMSNAEIAAAINSTVKTRACPAPILAVIAHVETFSLIDKLLYAKDSDAVKAIPQLLMAVNKALRIFVNPRITAISMEDPTVDGLVRQMFSAFVQAGIWTQGDADGLLAIGTESYPQWLDFSSERPLDHGDIIIAKGEKWEQHSIPNEEPQP